MMTVTRRYPTYSVKFDPDLFRDYVAGLPPETDEERAEPLYSSPRTIEQVVMQFAEVLKDRMAGRYRDMVLPPGFTITDSSSRERLT